MIKITKDNKYKCCGCTACMNVCPTNAIIMEDDEEGFLYPKVDMDKCINCGKCEVTCPIINKKKNENKINAYAIRTKELSVLETSTSGGFFTPVAKYILKKNGVVVGTTFDDNVKVIHKIIRNDNRDEINNMRGSKYVQSYLGDIFTDIKKILDETNQVVFFTGTPCQVSGLINFLGKEYENLVTMDFICHGVPSPKLWKKYVEYQENKNKSKIKKVFFRNKTYGYHSGTMKIIFENNREYYGSARVDYMLKSFFTEISSRPSCYKCFFKDTNHISDFTVFDCWSAEKIIEKFKDDDKGYTNLFINTAKGEKIFTDVRKEYDIFKISMDDAIKYDGPMVKNSAIPNINREKFYDSLNNFGLEDTIKRYINVSFKDKMIEFSKVFLYKTKLLYIIKNLRKKK